MSGARPRSPARASRGARAGAPRSAGRRRRSPENLGPAPGRRLLALLVVMGVAFAAVAVRLTDVQMVSTKRYAAYGQAEMLHRETLPARRGTIYARDGTVLAMSLEDKQIVADDFQIHHPAAEAARLASLIGQVQTKVQAALSRRSGFVRVARHVPPAVAAKVKALRLPGLTFQRDPTRVDPNGALALPLLGKVNGTGTGYSGIEEAYNTTLAGRAGSQVVQLDPAGRAIPGGSERVHPAVPGQGLVLTLDPAIQYETRQALAAEITKAHAAAGWAVVLDSRTGGVLATASLRAGGSPGSAPTQTAQPLALTRVYEPGSVAKLATFAGALTQGLITPTTPVVVPPAIKVGGATFSDAEHHGTEQLSATQVLAKSSNIGTIKIAHRLGPQGLYHWLRAIGWGKPTGLHIPGAGPGLLRPPSSWSGAAMGSMPIGQAEAVSALQLADSYNMVANGGTWVPPRLVLATEGGDGTRHPVAPPPRHRVLTPKVAAEVTGMLQQVVSPAGTAPKAAVPGYQVAGKTGTAQIPNPNGPGYQPGAFMASFVGFAPVAHPAVTIAITLEHPTPIYGGSVAAPLFSQLTSYALRRLDVPPGGASVPATTPAPTTIGRSAATARPGA